MTSKQRVLATLAHEEPDRVPMGEFAIDYAIIEKLFGRKSYHRGKLQLIEAYWEGRRDEVVESLKRDTVDLARELGFDMIRVDLVPDKDKVFPPFKRVDDQTWKDDWGGVYRYSEQTRDLMVMEAPTGGPAYDDPAEVVDGLRIPTESELEVADHVIAELGETHFIWAGPTTHAPGLPTPSALWVEPWIMALVDNPDGVREGRLNRAEQVGKIAAYWKSKGLDGLCSGEDLGFNSGPFMSPAQFRELFLPGYRAQAAASHEAGLPMMFHSCGNLTPMWADLADTGFDAYQAIQPEEDLADLKAAIGDRMALWGGVSCHNLVVNSPEEIREETARACEICKPGGGFILGSSHSIVVTATPENLLAMIDAGREYGRY